MANTDNKRASLEEAVRKSASELSALEESLGLLEALEQDRRAANLRSEIAVAYERHRQLVRCLEFGCECPEKCICDDKCPCNA